MLEVPSGGLVDGTNFKAMVNSREGNSKVLSCYGGCDL